MMRNTITAWLPQRRQQRGMTLIVSLIMLIVITIFAVSTMNLANSNLKIVGNQQAQRFVESAAQEGLETVLGSSSFFSTPQTQTLTINGLVVSVSKVVCIRSAPIVGSSAALSGATNTLPETNTFEVSATTTDSVTGARATVFQGIEINMPNGNCT